MNPGFLGAAGLLSALTVLTVKPPRFTGPLQGQLLKVCSQEWVVGKICNGPHVGKFTLTGHMNKTG
jgi:hypothetical protein